MECPWDREQDERSIVPHTVEEAYELADAAASGDDAKLLDELGDVLFQVHFLALLLEERGGGDFAAVAEQMTEKLIRRHPHVFAETEVASSGEVLANWDRIKQEKEGRTGLFADVPENLPALLYARKLQRRAQAAPPTALTWASSVPATPALPPPRSGRASIISSAWRSQGPTLRPPPRSTPAIKSSGWSGTCCSPRVDLARRLRCDPELALRAAARRFAASTSEA